MGPMPDPMTIGAAPNVSAEALVQDFTSPLPPDPGSGVRAGLGVRDLKFRIDPAFPVLF